LDLLGHWKRSGNPNGLFANFCEFLLGFGEERKWGGDVGGGWRRVEGKRVVWVGGLISSGPGNALENPNEVFASFCLGFGEERRGDGGEM